MIYLRKQDLRRLHAKDVFVQKAKAIGYRARSAYKLLEIEKKFRLLKNAKKIADLGSASGSWSQVAREKVPQNMQIILEKMAVSFIG